MLVMLAVAMLFTIPMILSASREILEESIIGHLSRGTPTTTATGDGHSITTATDSAQLQQFQHSVSSLSLNSELP